MRSGYRAALRHALVGCFVLGMNVPANAAIYNIAATDSAGVQITLTPNTTYLVRWIGTAEGGLYDSANVQLGCPQQCATGFSNAFSTRDEPFNPADFAIDSFSTGQLYGTAAASLAAYKAGNNIFHTETFITGGVVTGSNNLGPIPNPFIVRADGGTSRLFVLDTDGNRANNSGGVSLSIEVVNQAVPEPASWALMVAGFGLLGAAVRRSERTKVSYA